MLRYPTESGRLADQRVIREEGQNESDNNSLDDKQKKILSDLLALRAATPLQFELETNRIGQQDLVINSLKDLEKRGYVKADRRDSFDYLESAVFYPSWRTRWLRIFGRL